MEVRLPDLWEKQLPSCSRLKDVQTKQTACDLCVTFSLTTGASFTLRCFLAIFKTHFKTVD